MGLTPTPTQLKVLRGTDKNNPGRINPNEPKPDLGAKAPPWLPKKGVPWSTWLKHVKVLGGLQVLTQPDADALAMGCMALEEYLTMRDAGNFRMADVCAKRYLSVLIQFGMTPASRTRVSAVPTPTVDPLANWTAGRAAGGKP